MSYERYESEAQLPAQGAVYQALLADAALATLLGGAGKIYDGDADPCAAAPYVIIGETTGLPYRTHTRKGEEVTITIHIWSSYNGNAEVGAILARVNALLGDAPLVIPGYDVVRCFFDFGQTIKDDVAKMRHGIVRYRIIAQEQIAA